MSRLKILLIILVLVLVVPIWFIQNNINKRCVKAASKATCSKLSLRDKLTIYAGKTQTE